MITFERAMEAKRKTKHYYITHNLATTVCFNSDHYDVDRTIVGLS